MNDIAARKTMNISIGSYKTFSYIRQCVVYNNQYLSSKLLNINPILITSTLKTKQILIK